MRDAFLLRVRIADRIRNHILSGKVQPGERLSISDLAKSLKVSPTPIQDALLILEQEGLVVIKPRSGVYVKVFSQEEIVDLLKLEGACESIAVSMAAHRITPKQLSYLQKIHSGFKISKKISQRDFRNYDLKFHSSIIRFSGSPILIANLNKNLYQIQLSRYYTSAAPNRIRHSLKEHDEILNFLGEGDADKAEAALKRHISSAIADFLAA